MSRRSNTRKQLLYFSHEELQNQYFAVIRITEFAEGRPWGVWERNIHTYDEDVVGTFTEIVGTALAGGADVSAISIATAEELGIEPL
jgi:hypothetical protein|tara:strand:- start:914 stop:1174 length:261 start_codon:yes stop_codon:yes gene_type:complete